MLRISRRGFVLLALGMQASLAGLTAVMRPGVI
jgi:hypothetical protein